MIKSLEKNKAKTNMSFHDRLLSLPDMFSLNGMTRHFSMDRQVALNCLKEWKKKGYIEPFGFRTSWYFNTLKNKKAKEEKWYNALQEIYPEAVHGGVNEIRQAGWMTQISPKEEVIVRNRLRYYQVDEVEWMPRSVYWFRRYHDGMTSDGPRRKLSPEYALVDLCEAGKYIPDPDDLFLDETEILKIKDAFAKLKVDIPPKLWEVLEYDPKSTPKTLKKARP